MHKVWEFFLDKYKFTFILILAIVVFGVFSIVQLPKESQPEVDIPVATVTTVFPGASAIDVEQLVTDKVEDKVSSLDGVKEYTSRSRRGSSFVQIEFSANTNKRDAVDDLKKKIDQVEGELPDKAEDPQVEEVELSDQPFMQISLGGPFSIVKLTDYAESIKDNLEQVNGISEVTLVGEQKDELQVIVDRSKLQTYSLNIRDVTQAIDQANSDIPIGEIETSGQIFSLRLSGRIEQPEQIRNIPIDSTEDTVVQISDVGQVKTQLSDRDSLSRLSTNNQSSQPAITLMLYDSPGGDITEISSRAKKSIEEMVSEQMPQSLDYMIVDDRAEQIAEDLTSLTRNGLTTIAIVFLVLWLILSLREALIASVALPLSFMITFVGLNLIGLSLNFMTLFSLILALGIIIDTAIVINEGISANLEQGMDPAKAAKSAIKEFQWPLIAGVLTTVFAFVPMLLTGGQIGEFIKSIPITVSLVLSASLFVALSIITTINAFLALYRNKNQSAGKSQVAEKTEKVLDQYGGYLKSILSSKQKRKRLGYVVVGLIIFSYSLPVLGVLDINMFPPSNTDKFTIEIEQPIGTTLETSSNFVEQVEQKLQQDERITSYVANVGASLGSRGVSAQNQANITVNLVNEDQRGPSTKIVDEYQSKLSQMSRADVSVTQRNTGPEQQAPVVITISGDNLDKLDRTAKRFESLLAEIEGTKNIDSTVKDTNGEFVIDVDRVKAKRYGVSTRQLASSLRNMVNGSTASSINQSGTDLDIVVRSDLSQEAGDPNQTDIETIRSMEIATKKGMMPLSKFGEIRLQNNRIEINHKDGDRITEVTSYTESGTTASEIFNEVQTKIDQGEIDIPQGYSVALGGENEDIQKSFMDMFQAMFLAMLLIASLLVLQFESFKQALIILITIPLALIGVFPGLAVLNLPLSFPGIIGVVALVGIVVNNAILLIDTINRKKEKQETKKAIVEAGKERLRPIVLTTVTTVLGIFPLALTEEVWMSLGFAIIFGLLFSTVLTLVVIPVLYNKLLA
ncbi:MAG: efflux RND transporter permease subunit [Candidatus Magasanikbacteria bacterium]